MNIFETVKAVVISIGYNVTVIDRNTNLQEEYELEIEDFQDLPEALHQIMSVVFPSGAVPSNTRIYYTWGNPQRTIITVWENHTYKGTIQVQL